MFKTDDADFIKLVRLSGSEHKATALQAQAELAKAILTPLRQAVFDADNIRGTNIYETVLLEPDANINMPVDAINPGEEHLFTAYTSPGYGRIPERAIEGDYVMIPTFKIVNSIDWALDNARTARLDLVGRAMEALVGGFVKKINDVGWHTIITAGVDRNILVYDADASAGQFTKRLVSLMDTNMKRQGGGNAGSLRKGRMTDLFISLEAKEDIRNWGLDQIDEVTRREFFLAADGNIQRIFGVNMHEMYELGVGQEYQQFYTNVLAAGLQTSDVELVVGLDLVNRDAFHMPFRQDVEIYEDDALHRRQRGGFYGWANLGAAVLDTRRVILGSF